MELLLLGAGMGLVGGLMPSPLHLIALSQVALNRWGRALLVLVGAPVLVDGALLIVTFFFYQYVPRNISHSIAYVGGATLLAFGTYALLQMRSQRKEELARSQTLTYASVAAALLAEVSAPGTWIFWLTIAGPILAEGRQEGYLKVVPFFAGSLFGYYGAAVFAVWLMAWGASLHKGLKARLYFFANILLLVLGVFYVLRARFRL
jgi:threonine/homoserine/homoserine lactone efflux protein